MTRERAPLDDYIEAQPLLRHVHVMRRVMEWVDRDPETRRFYPELHCAYMDILAEEFAPHALMLALALTELEDAYPEIVPEEE